MTFHTVGHSTRSAAELLEILRAHGVGLLVDVRRHPGSRRHPHFNRDELAAFLEDAGIGYRHEEALGGRRSAAGDLRDVAGWESEGFRAYAAHLNGPEGRTALDRLEEDAGETPAVMCAEAVPWRCHRQIVADHLVARGHEVVHLLGPDRRDAHRLRGMAEPTEDGRVLYPPGDGGQAELFAD